MSDQGESEADEHEWSELDELGLQRNIRKRLTALPDGYTYAQKAAALQRLFDIVRSEVAIALAADFNNEKEFGPQDTRQDAQRTADALNSSIARLGLTIRHPKTGTPSKISVAPTAGKSESWLLIEPLDSSARELPMRLPIPGMKLQLDLLAIDKIDPGRGRAK